MELDEAKEIIGQRFSLPTFEQLKKAFGVGVFNSGYNLTLKIDWAPIEKFLDNDNDAQYADACMQLLQNVSLWDGFKKGIIRYISEDKDQLQLFVNNVDVMKITFSTTIDTDAIYSVKEKLLSYSINCASQEFFSSNVLYERLLDVFDELVESGEHQQFASYNIQTSPSSVGTPSTPRDDLPNSNMVKNASKDNLAVDQNDASNKIGANENAQQQNYHHHSSNSGGFKNLTPPAQGNSEFPAPAFIDPSDFLEDEILYTATQKSVDAIKSENNLLSTGRHIEDLKTICRQPRILVNGDLLGVKYMLKKMADLFWKPSEADAKIIQVIQKHAKKISTVMNMSANFNEQLIKVWKITKVNVKGLQQERYLVLTTLRLYTAKMAKDKETPQVDEKHFKHFDLINFVMVDVARFKPTSNQKLQPFGLCLYIRDPNKNPPPQATAADKSAASLSLDKSAEGGEDGAAAAAAPKKKKKKGIAAKIEKAVRKGSLAFAKRRESVMGGDKNDQRRERPKTDDLYKAYFMAPPDVHISEYQQRFLNEVAWCIYATALALKKSVKDCHEPFEDTPIARPESSVSAFLYNKLGLGKN